MAMINLNGWMRLWIVLSVAWLLFIGYLAYGDFAEIYGQKKFDVEIDGIGHATFVFSSSQTDLDIQHDISTNLVNEFKQDPRSYLRQIITRPYDRYLLDHLPQTRAKYLKLAFLPVLGLLGLGWLTAWVRRGFSQQKIL